MKIRSLIEELESIEKKHGNIECTCTGSYQVDGYDVFETTVENFIIKQEGAGGLKFKRVRLLL